MALRDVPAMLTLAPAIPTVEDASVTVPEMLPTTTGTGGATGLTASCETPFEVVGPLTPKSV